MTPVWCQGPQWLGKRINLRGKYGNSVQTATKGLTLKDKASKDGEWKPNLVKKSPRVAWISCSIWDELDEGLLQMAHQGLGDQDDGGWLKKSVL